MRLNAFAVGLSAALAVTMAAPASAQQPLTLKPAGSPLSVQPPFAKDSKARKAISGAACAPTTPKVCLAVNDEKKYAQFFTIDTSDGAKLVPGDLIRLAPNNDGELEINELDLEGAAYDNGFFYAVGSHGAPRDPDKPFDPSRFSIYRFRVDPQTGIPAFKHSGNLINTSAIVRSGKLREAIKAADKIGPLAEQPLGKNGANIEGIAVRDGRIYLGFRAPSIDGSAFIMEVGADAVFGKASVKPVVHALKLGKDVGIRDLAAVKSGFLVLAGPSPGVSGSGLDYPVFHWDGKSAVKPLGPLGSIPGDGKPETLVVLDDTEGQPWRVLILIENRENAEPTEYVIAR
jgi:hypothetical protein